MNRPTAVRRLVRWTARTAVVAACFVVPLPVTKAILSLVDAKHDSVHAAIGWTASAAATFVWYAIARRWLFATVVHRRSVVGVRSGIAGVAATVAGAAVYAAILIGSYFLTFETAHVDNLDGSLIVCATAASLVPAVYEEILFRDLLLRASIAAMPTWAALAVQIVVFGGLHVIAARSTGINVASMAVSTLLLSALWLRRRALGPPVAIHFAWDFALNVLHGVSTPAIVRAGLFYTSDSPKGAEIHLVVTMIVLILVCASFRWRPADRATAASCAAPDRTGVAIRA